MGGVDAAVYQLIGTQPNGGPRPAEAIQRLVLAMLNEAARAVGEGIVARPRGGDIAAVFGFGVSPFRGGGSEERRGGKEGRFRRLPFPLKKKRVTRIPIKSLSICVRFI